MDLNDCLVEFLNYQHLKNNSPATVDNYRIFCGKFIKYCDNVDSYALSADNVNNFNVYLRQFVNPISVRTYIRHIRVFIRFCINKGYCKDFYKDIIIPKQHKHVVDILTPAEIKKLLGVFNNGYYDIRNKAMILLMLDCGLRANEVISLKVSNINIDYRYIKVFGKGKKDRIVPLGNTVLNALLNYVDIRARTPVDILFLSMEGVPLQRSVFKKIFYRLRVSTGIAKLHPHLLRHTFATNYLLYSDGDIYQLSMLLGHSDVSTTEIYLHYANYYRFMQHKQIFSFVDNIENQKKSRVPD